MKKKIEKLRLEKTTLGELQNDEMVDLVGGGRYDTEFYFGSSINTQFTNYQSCCGGDCARTTCYGC